MKVQATDRGYYGSKIRLPGEKFTLKSKDDLSKRWMKKRGKEAANESSDPADDPKHHTVHRGAGKWDVFDQSGNVVPDGDNLKKADAHALVDKLNAED